MSAFGWSYPPGCNGPPEDDYDEFCAVCGQVNCVCPTCRQCGCAGLPLCYFELDDTGAAHRHMTAEQHRARADAEKKAAERQRWEDAQAELYGQDLPELPDDWND